MLSNPQFHIDFCTIQNTLCTLLAAQCCFKVENRLDLHDQEMFEESCQNSGVVEEIQQNLKKLSDTSVRSVDSGQFSGSSAKQVRGVYFAILNKI